jgi:hypothetical protein
MCAWQGDKRRRTWSGQIVEEDIFYDLEDIGTPLCELR